jgi:hypothetical protein
MAKTKNTPKPSSDQTTVGGGRLAAPWNPGHIIGPEADQDGKLPARDTRSLADRLKAMMPEPTPAEARAPVTDQGVLSRVGVLLADPRRAAQLQREDRLARLQAFDAPEAETPAETREAVSDQEDTPDYGPLPLDERGLPILTGEADEDETFEDADLWDDPDALDDEDDDH